MLKLRIIVVGRDKNDPILTAAAGYAERLGHYASLEVIEVKEEPATKSVPLDRVKAKEAERLEAALAPDDFVIVLDEGGKALSSSEVAQRLAKAQNDGVRSLAFLIGGPNGFDPRILARGRERWSLSRLTLPHRIARLLLLEQLYRGFTILRGEPYHK